MPADTKPIGLAIVGSGRIGTLRARLASAHPAGRFIAVSDRSEAAAARLAKTVGAQFHSIDNDEIIAHPDVNAVIVSTSEGEHVAPILKAISLGKKVLVEKPLALTLADADLIEINEAFAAQVMACCAAAASDDYARQHLGRDRALGVIPPEKLNVNGGAIALGHPVGASGARLALTALKELKRRNARRALVSLCVGGGQGGALWLEVV